VSQRGLAYGARGADCGSRTSAPHRPVSPAASERYRRYGNIVCPGSGPLDLPTRCRFVLICSCEWQAGMASPGATKAASGHTQRPHSARQGRGSSDRERGGLQSRERAAGHAAAGSNHQSSRRASIMYWLRENHEIHEDAPLPVVSPQERCCELEMRELRQDFRAPSPPPRGLSTSNRYPEEARPTL